MFDGNYQLVNLSSAEFDFLQACVPPRQGGHGGTPPLQVGGKSVGEILADVEMGLDEVRSILSKQLILLTPGGKI
ncbi:hypothetical protein [Microcoleus sp. herbarium2]|uniref:hypothetical protein n=1 Tax=Microcoleus sp. herbarium2 TaxID=3055433 RepID=UPI002FD3FD9A